MIALTIADAARLSAAHLSLLAQVDTIAARLAEGMTPQDAADQLHRSALAARSMEARQ